MMAGWGVHYYLVLSAGISRFSTRWALNYGSMALFFMGSHPRISERHWYSLMPGLLDHVNSWLEDIGLSGFLFFSDDVLT